MRKKKRNSKVRLFVLILFLAICFVLPFYLVIINSLKTLGEIELNPFSLPTVFHWENYAESWQRLDIGKALVNTLIITFFSVALIMLLSSMAAYWTVRHATRLSKVFEMLLLGSILIPFPTIMLPLAKTLSAVGLSGTYMGGILVYTGMGIAFAYFILRGAVMAIPKELDEAALVDGCSVYRIFFSIILRLMTPTLISVCILDVFWVWNDYNIALVVLNTAATRTIQLNINSMFAQYITRWDYALPALVIGILPIVIMNILLQKKILEGMTAGALKG